MAVELYRPRAIVDRLADELFDLNEHMYGQNVAVLGRDVGRALGRVIRRRSPNVFVDRVRKHRRVGDLPTNDPGSLPNNNVISNNKRPNRGGGKSVDKMSSRQHRRVRGGRKVTKRDPYRVSMKIERGVEVDAWNCSFAGGWTHPEAYTFGILAQAVLRFLAVRARIDFSHFQETMVSPGTTSQTFAFVYWWRQTSPTVSALTKVAVSATGITTWAAFAEDIADSFVATFGEGPVSAGPPSSASPQRQIVYIGLDGTSASPVLASQFYKADEMFIEIKGESHIQVQNRTIAEGGSESTDVVRSNPLRGKYYQFNRGRPMIISPGNLTAVATDNHVFPADILSGYIYAYDRTGASPGTTIFPASVVNAVSKPVVGNFFNNCRRTKYCSAAPGEIMRSSIQKTYVFPLSKWLSVFREKFLQAGAKTFANLLVFGDPVSYKLGVSHCYGFEKMCDTTVATDNEIKLGLEQNLFLSSRVYHRPKSGVVAQVVL